MENVASADGTQIAYERSGRGTPLVLIGGALCDRSITRPLARALEDDFTVVSYDRRGRGDSGDTTPYAVAREVEDLAAVITALGGSAAVMATRQAPACSSMPRQAACRSPGSCCTSRRTARTTRGAAERPVRRAGGPAARRTARAAGTCPEGLLQSAMISSSIRSV
ncbi:alpha/beta hydrolase [Kribbella sp. NPDC051770]|uniref:alpha/beta fold hydrolase n=1 Tax=Kribbella sp. NPDC051770 TaxID=3155413 RepID=UPI00343B8CFF